jgi:cysteine-rich repeat protein
MRRGALLWLACLAGCGKADGIVVVSVTADPPLSEISALHTQLTVGTHSQTIDVLPVGEAAISLPPAHTFGVAVPPSLGRTLHVAVEARDSAGQSLGSASGDAPIHSDGSRSDLTLTILGMAGADLAGADFAGNDLAVSVESDLAMLAGSDAAAGDLGQDLSPRDPCQGVTGCVKGDGCCFSGCNAVNDDDCQPVCGNNITEPGEVCDDGNTLNGDNCDPGCQYYDVVTTLAGTPTGMGYTDGETGTIARFRGVQAIAGDANANALIGDITTIRTMGNVVGTPTLLAGRVGVAAHTDGNGVDARFTHIYDLTVLGTNAYIIDTNLLRVMDLSSSPKPVTTVSGFDATGITGISNDGVKLLFVGGNGLQAWDPTTNVSTISVVNDLSACQDSNDTCQDVEWINPNYYLPCNSYVCKVTSGGTASVFSGSKTSPAAPCTDNASDPTMAGWSGLAEHVAQSGGQEVYVTDTGCGTVRKVSVGASPGVTDYAGAEGTAAYADGSLSAARFYDPWTMGVVGARLLVADSRLQTRVRGVDLLPGSPQVSTLAGADSVYVSSFTYGATGASTVFPNFNTTYGGLVTDGTYVYLTSRGGAGDSITQVALSNGASSQMVAQSLGGSAGITLIGSTLYSAHGDGTIRTTPVGGNTFTLFAGTPGTSSPAMNASRLSAVLSPGHLTTDGTNLFFVDRTANLIRKIDLGSGAVSTVAGVAGSSDVHDDPVGTNAHFQKPTGLTCDGASLYVIDGNPATVVRKIDLGTTGVTTILGAVNQAGAVDAVGTAARFAGATDLTTDGKVLVITDGGLGFAQGDFNGPTLREVELSSLSVTTMIGRRGQWTTKNGAGSAALVNAPGLIAYDSTTRSFVVYDLSENVLRKIQ